MDNQYLQAARIRNGRGSQQIFSIHIFNSIRRGTWEPITLVACGDMIPLENVEIVDQPINFPARTIIALKIAEFYNAFQNEPSVQLATARTWADLTASWVVLDKCNEQDMVQALRQMTDILGKIPPKADNIINAWQRVYDRLAIDAMAGTVPWAEASEVMIPNDPNKPPEIVAIQKYRFFLASAHAIDYSSLFQTNTEIDKVLAALKIIDDQPVLNIPKHNWVLREDWQRQWNGLPQSELLAFYEMLYASDPKYWDEYLVAAVAGTILGICSFSGMTQGELMSLVTRIVNKFPDLKLKDKLKVEYINKFRHLYVPKNINSDVLNNFLRLSYGAVTVSTANSFSWIIEQARDHKFIHASCFATSVIDHDFIPLYYLRDIPRIQWINYIKVMVHLVMDPLGSVTQPVNAAETYPDIANLGVALMKLNDKYFKYADNFIYGGTMRQFHINAMARAIVRLYREATEIKNARNVHKTINVLQKLKFICPSFQVTKDFFPSLQVAKDDGSNRKLNVNSRTATEQFGAAEEVIKDDQKKLHGDDEIVLDAEVLEALRQQRLDWPVEARNLPINTVELTKADMVDLFKYIIKNNDLTKALMDTCQRVQYAVNQQSVKLKGRYSVPPIGLEETLAAWNLTIKEIIPNIPPPPHDPKLKRPKRAVVKPRSATIATLC